MIDHRASDGPWRNNASHWGVFRAAEREGRLTVIPSPSDSRPSGLLANIESSVRHEARVKQPMIRAGWLSEGAGPTTRRGMDDFIPVSWDEASDLVSSVLREAYGGPAGGASVFGGSYGWSSAGRFHHAQSQVHRFLNCLGGYVSSATTYSSGAAEVLLGRVFADWRDVANGVTWPEIERHTDLVLSFGGMAVKNMAVAPGGISNHRVLSALEASRRRGCSFVLVSPLADDFPAALDAHHLAIRPGTDVALMLALAHELVLNQRVDHDFLRRYTIGYEIFEAYVLGRPDGIAKNPEWAERETGIPAGEIRVLADRMSRSRTLITVAYSLQRAEHGEQPVWAALALAAMLGQIGEKGGGYSFALGAMGHIGMPSSGVKVASLPQGRNPIGEYIPVARIADMLLNPGGTVEFNGSTLTYPKIDVVYWAGGNPFHHHQDLNRLRRALARPRTVVVHEIYWTPMAMHADIVLPATTTLERNDLGSGLNDTHLVAMQQVMRPLAQARTDFEILAGIADRLGVGDAFTEGRNEMQWLEWMYNQTWASAGLQDWAPAFEEFWEQGQVELPQVHEAKSAYADFIDDPQSAPLNTASGRIEIYSELIASFGYDDCGGHPQWYPPIEGWRSELAAKYPLQLIANQPATRLHSQLDMGAWSQASKIQGREPVRINPIDASKRGITHGSIVRLFNSRGACYAGAIVTDDVLQGVVQLATGAWYAPCDGEGTCAHGNPNVLTRDVGTSQLAQGCTGQLTLVELELAKDAPPVHPHGEPRPTQAPKSAVRPERLSTPTD